MYELFIEVRRWLRRGEGVSDWAWGEFEIAVDVSEDEDQGFLDLEYVYHRSKLT